jgi:hypothetical protein
MARRRGSGSRAPARVPRQPHASSSAAAANVCRSPAPRPAAVSRADRSGGREARRESGFGPSAGLGRRPRAASVEVVEDSPLQNSTHRPPLPCGTARNTIDPANATFSGTLIHLKHLLERSCDANQVPPFFRQRYVSIFRQYSERPSSSRALLPLLKMSRSPERQSGSTRWTVVAGDDPAMLPVAMRAARCRRRCGGCGSVSTIAT